MRVFDSRLTIDLNRFRSISIVERERENAVAAAGERGGVRRVPAAQRDGGGEPRARQLPLQHAQLPRLGVPRRRRRELLPLSRLPRDQLSDVPRVPPEPDVSAVPDGAAGGGRHRRRQRRRRTHAGRHPGAPNTGRATQRPIRAVFGPQP